MGSEVREGLIHGEISLFSVSHAVQTESNILYLFLSCNDVTINNNTTTTNNNNNKTSICEAP